MNGRYRPRLFRRVVGVCNKALHDGWSALETRLRRLVSLRVLAVLIVVTILSGRYVYGEVVSGVGPTIPFIYEVAIISLGGIVLALWSGQPVTALVGTAFFGIAVVKWPGCVPLGCSGVKQLHVFFDWTVLGPSMKASYAVESCKHVCTHTVEVIPLVIGYLLIGDSIATTN